MTDRPALRAATAAAMLAVALGAAACSGEGEEDEAWAGPGPGLGQLDPSAFNDYAESVDESWRRAPALTAGEFVRVDAADARATTIEATTGPEGGPSASATVVLDGLLDDSVRARRYVLDLVRDDDGRWTVVSALATQRCWPRRGHQGYAPTPCR